MNTQRTQIRNREGRFRPRRVWLALPAVLAIFAIAAFGSAYAFADSTDASAKNTGQQQNDNIHRNVGSPIIEQCHMAVTHDQYCNSGDESIGSRGLATSRIVSNGVRMYEVGEFEAGGWPVRGPGADTYGLHELIAIEVQFSEDVNVNGSATFRIQLGSNNRRELVPVSRRGDSIIFATLVQPGERDADGVWVGDHTSTLAHNPASYFRSADDGQNVSLTHSSLGTQTNHKVDGNSERPKINRVRITSSPQYGDAYVRGETVQLEASFDRSVAVSGNPAARLRIEAFGSTTTRTANYVRGSGTSKLIFEYGVSLLDNDSNGIAVPSNTLAKDGDVSNGPQGGGSIQSTSRTLRANLTSGGRGNNASHKVDARYVAASEVMANAQWGWKTQTGRSDSITMDFTIREDPGHFSEDHALVMAFGWSSIGSTRFGFGIRTDLDDPDTDGSEGKGIVFNRWDTHDTSLARPTTDGWVVTGTILGNFISIRKPYDWGVGDYTVRIAHDGSDNDADGRWFGMWITDPNGMETHMGSLKFPLVDGAAPKFNPRGDLYQSMLALLGGGVIKPHEIPVFEVALSPLFEVALSPPDEGSGIDPPKRVTAVYSQFNGVMTNSNIAHDREDNLVIMRAGGSTLRTTNPGTVITIRNDPATGKPIIRGTEELGQSLGVNTDEISDADGPDEPSFTYQWLRSDGTSDTPINGAVTRFYTLTRADVGKTVKVRVSFTDDAGFEESLTSDATETIQRPPLTAEFRNTPTSHDGQNSFTFELRFSENISGLSYVTLRDHAFGSIGGTVTKARRLEPPGNVRWEITVEPHRNGAATVTLPATTNCQASGAICTGDERMLVGPTTITVTGPGG